MAALLQMLEDGVVFRDLTLENPIRGIREISHDTTCRRKVRLANGRELSALDIQWEYLERAIRYGRIAGVPCPGVSNAVEMWEYLLTGLEKDPLSLDREVRLGGQAPSRRAVRRGAVDARCRTPVWRCSTSPTTT